MIAHSPRESAHAVDIDVLQAGDIAIWSAWSGNKIAGIGALRALSAGLGELKCMRTHPDFTHQGVGSAVLRKLLEEARNAELTSVAIETGSGGPFENTIAFYIRHGFEPCAPFGGYAATPFNRFYSRLL